MNLLDSDQAQPRILHSSHGRSAADDDDAAARYALAVPESAVLSMQPDDDGTNDDADAATALNAGPPSDAARFKQRSLQA